MHDLNEIKRLVTKNAIDDLEGTGDLELASAEHKAAVDISEKEVRIINDIDKTTGEIKLTQAKIRDLEERRAMDYEIEMKKIEIDKKDRWVKHGIAIGTGVLKALVIAGTTVLYLVYDHRGEIMSPGMKKAVDRLDKNLSK